MSDQHTLFTEKWKWFLKDGEKYHEAFVDALRAFAEEARREERIVAAEHAEMRYADGYECGVKDEREALVLWAKGRCGHCQIAAEDFAADRLAALRAREEGKG